MSRRVKGGREAAKYGRGVYGAKTYARGPGRYYDSTSGMRYGTGGTYGPQADAPDETARYGHDAYSWSRYRRTT